MEVLMRYLVFMIFGFLGAYIGFFIGIYYSENNKIAKAEKELQEAEKKAFPTDCN